MGHNSWRAVFEKWRDDGEKDAQNDNVERCAKRETRKKDAKRAYKRESREEVNTAS
jgi:hypothetical protein